MEEQCRADREEEQHELMMVRGPQWSVKTGVACETTEALLEATCNK